MGWKSRIGTTASAVDLFPSVHLPGYFSAWLAQLFLVAHFKCMRLVCSLDRYTRGFRHCPFFDLVWRQHAISVCIFELLCPGDQHRLSRAHIIITVERQEIALDATAQTLGLDYLSSYSVPTPPVARGPQATQTEADWGLGDSDIGEIWDSDDDEL
jgi:hypothetical protein